MHVEAYIYDRCFDVVYDDGQTCCVRKSNMPVNKKPIKLHKGSDNKVNFRVRNNDLKSVDIASMTIKAKVVDRQNKEKVLEKYLDVSLNKGIAVLDVLEGDLVDIAPGYYELILQNEDSTATGQVDYYSQSSFYVDQDDNISFVVEITAQGDTAPFPTIELLNSTFRPIFTREQKVEYHTNAVACNALRNNRNSNHTFVLYCEGFTGTVQVFGSLDMTPPENIGDYFPIEIIPGMNQITFEDHTGVEPFNFGANLMWAKFVITPDINSEQELGKITKVLWRS